MIENDIVLNFILKKMLIILKNLNIKIKDSLI